MIALTLDRSVQLANLMIAYKYGDQSRYLVILKQCEKWMDPFYYNFYFNLGKSSVFTRKGYYK